MKVTLRFPSAWLAFLQRPVSEVIAPDYAPEWHQELRLKALTETHRVPADNLVFVDFTRLEKRR